MDNREEQRRRNRELMPNLAELVDEFRSVFPDAKLVWGVDKVTGYEVGKQEELDPDKVFEIPRNYHPSQQIETKGKRK